MNENGRGVGFFVISKSGHDKDETYIIVDSHDGQTVLVANGRNRTIQQPKRKSVRHLFITKTRVPGFEKILNNEAISSNLKIAARIKDFRKKHTPKS